MHPVMDNIAPKSKTPLKILSWNINGIRTAKNLKQTLDSLDADIICLQETKVTRDIIDEPTALIEGYNAFFSFSRARSGYSGVATYCKEHVTPIHAEEGLSGTLCTLQQSDIIGCYNKIEDEFTPQELKRLDAEGRAVITQHEVKDLNGTGGLLTVFNVYCPRADPERPDRLEFKLRFYRLLELRAAAVRCEGSHVVIVGDINTSHRHIDRCENVSQDEFEANPGRKWLNEFVDNSEPKGDGIMVRDDNESSFKMVDSFRYFHPNEVDFYTCWNTMINARATNYGSRIDYVFVDRTLIGHMIDSVILMDVLGSDHCPVAGTFNVEIVKAKKCPSLCIKYYPEFAGTQQKLSSFFVKKTNFVDSESTDTGKRNGMDTVLPPSKKICMADESLKNCTVKPLSKTDKAEKNLSQRGIMNFFIKTNSSEKEVDSDGSVGGSLSQESSSSSASDGSSIPFRSEEVKSEKATVAMSAWRSMLTGPRPPPLCKGHKEPCVQRTVKKKGPNFNRKFYTCARGEGSKNDPRARCDHFEWALKK